MKLWIRSRRGPAVCIALHYSSSIGHDCLDDCQLSREVSWVPEYVTSLGGAS